MSNEDILELGADVMPNMSPIERPSPPAHIPYTPPNIDYRTRDLEGANAIYDKTTDETQSHRRILLDKLMCALSSTKFDTSEKADSELLQAQLRLANECRSILNDIDGAENRSFNSKLKMKDMENNRQGSTDIVNILSKINLTTVHVSNAMQNTNPDDAVRQAFERANCDPIRDIEIDDTPNMLPTKKDDDPFS